MASLQVAQDLQALLLHKMWQATYCQAIVVIATTLVKTERDKVLELANIASAKLVVALVLTLFKEHLALILILKRIL